MKISVGSLVIVTKDHFSTQAHIRKGAEGTVIGLGKTETSLLVKVTGFNFPEVFKTTELQAVIASYATTEEEDDLIAKIVERIKNSNVFLMTDTMALFTDLTICHASGNPIDLSFLLTAPDETFKTDIRGIRKNLNRITGRLENGFIPQSSKKKVL